MKEEALKLADWLESKSKLGWAGNFGQELDEASAIIRRLVEELDIQEAKEVSYQEMIDDAQTQIALLKNGEEPFGWLGYDPHWFLDTQYYVHGKEKPKSRDGYIATPLYTTPQTKPLSDEEKQLVREIVGNYVCTIKMEIDQEKQTFKGYEHCSNIPSLQSELKDAEKAIDVLRKAWD